LLYVTNSGSDIVSVINSEGYPILDHIIDGSPRAVEAGVKDSSKIFVLTNNNMKSSLDNKIYLINGFYNRIDNKIPIAKNQFLVAMAANPNTVHDNTVYLAGQYGLNSTVYANNFTGIALKSQTQNITLNATSNDNRDIAVDPITNRTYIANAYDKKIFVTNSTKEITSLTIDGTPRSVAVAVNQNKNTSKVYVGVLPDLVFVINGSSNRPYLLNKNITVGGEPRDIEVNPKTNTIYVADYNSGTISVINGSSDKVMGGVTFKVNPANSGNIICNDQRISKSYTRYDIGTLLICKADANAGFQFSSWSSDFDLGNPVPIPTVFHSIYFSIFGAPHFTNFTVSKYGTLSANFVNLTTIPPEFWTPFYALIPTFIGSTFIPSIYHAIKQKRTQNRNLKEYIDKIGKVDKSKIEEEITNLHTNGQISESGYNRLKDEISKYYKDKGTAMPHGVR
jgi:YVTN family beta-propeller protein